MRKPMERVTVTLPSELVDQLDLVSKIIPCSRSALVSLMLSESIGIIEKVCFDIREVNPDHIILKRARGQSISKIEERYKEILSEFEMYQ